MNCTFPIKNQKGCGICLNCLRELMTENRIKRLERRKKKWKELLSITVHVTERTLRKQEIIIVYYVYLERWVSV